MPHALLVYHSLTGSTGKVCDKIAEGLKEGGYSIEKCSLVNSQPPAINDVDLLGIGFPVYYYQLPFNVREYIKNLSDLEGKNYFLFMLHGTYPGETISQANRLLSTKNGKRLGEFSSYGEGYFYGYLINGYRFSVDHPDEKELEAAKDFGIKMANGVQVKEGKRENLGTVYQLIKISANRWLADNIYSRFFKVDKEKCIHCGTCVRSCPKDNITIVDDYPDWGQDCIICMNCQVWCPTGAIKGFLDLDIIQPLIKNSIRDAEDDQNIETMYVDTDNWRQEIEHPEKVE